MTGAHDDDHAEYDGEQFRDEIMANVTDVSEDELATDASQRSQSNAETVTVSLAGDTEAIPVDEAVTLNHEMLANPESFGIATEQTVRSVSGEVATHGKQIAELYEAVNIPFDSLDRMDDARQFDIETDTIFEYN